MSTTGSSAFLCARLLIGLALFFGYPGGSLAKEKPIFAAGDHLTPAPLVSFAATKMLAGGKPDTQIMVSKTHVVLVTTSGVGFYTKEGKQIDVIDDLDFFCTRNKTPMPDGTLMSDFLAANKNASPAWGFGDCKALYDHYRDRFWFLATFNNAYPGDGRMFWAVAVSNSGDPTQGWRTFVLPAHRRDDQRYTNSDFPMIGMDREAFYVSVEVLVVHPEDKLKNYLYVLALSADDLVTGKDLGSVRTAELTNWPDPQNHKPFKQGLLMPAINTGLGESTSGMKFVSAFSTTAGIWSLQHPFSKHPQIRAWTVPMSSVNPEGAGIKAHQKGTSELAPIALGGAVVSVTQSGNDLHFVAQDVGRSGKDKKPCVAIRYLKVSGPEPSARAPHVVKDIKYGATSPEESGAELNYVIPSAMVNKNGDVIVVENSVGQTIFQQARATAIYHDSASADYSALVRLGEGANTGGWGDIAQATLDPADHTGIWVATQFGAGHQGQLAVARFFSNETARISKDWPGLWANTVQAATPWPNGRIYLFRGSEYIRYDAVGNKADPGYPQLIASAWPGVWPDGFDTVAAWPNGKAYFFRGDQYLRYDIKADKADDGYPKPIALAWPGIWKDGRIDAVVVWPNGKAYFFRGDQYISYDIKTDKADAGFPKPMAGDWPGLWADGIDAGVVFPDGTFSFFKRGDYFRGKTSKFPVAGN